MKRTNGDIAWAWFFILWGALGAEFAEHPLVRVGMNLMAMFFVATLVAHFMTRRAIADRHELKRRP